MEAGDAAKLAEEGGGDGIKEPECTESRVSVCAGHGASCCSTGLSTHTFVCQCADTHTHSTQGHTHTHALFALEDDPRRPRQEVREPSKEQLSPTPHPPTLSTTTTPQRAPPSCPFKLYLDQSQRAGAEESHSAHREVDEPRRPPILTARLSTSQSHGLE